MLEETSTCGGPIGIAALFNLYPSLSRSSHVVSSNVILDVAVGVALDITAVAGNLAHSVTLGWSSSFGAVISNVALVGEFLWWFVWWLWLPWPLGAHGMRLALRIGAELSTSLV